MFEILQFPQGKETMYVENVGYLGQGVQKWTK